MSVDPAVDVVWRPLCDCTDRGEADEPSPGPDPGLCALCWDRIRAEWTPLVLTEQENPTMNRHHPTSGRDPEEIFEEARERLREGFEEAVAEATRRDPVGWLAKAATLVVILLLFAFLASVLLWGILTVWEAM